MPLFAKLHCLTGREVYLIRSIFESSYLGVEDSTHEDLIGRYMSSLAGASILLIGSHHLFQVSYIGNKDMGESIATYFGRRLLFFMLFS